MSNPFENVLAEGKRNLHQQLVIQTRANGRKQNNQPMAAVHLSVMWLTRKQVWLFVMVT